MRLAVNVSIYLHSSYTSEFMPRKFPQMEARLKGRWFWTIISTTSVAILKNLWSIYYFPKSALALVIRELELIEDDKYYLLVSV